jgi:hypothetical protein
MAEKEETVKDVASEELVDEVDVEATACECRRRPRARRYRIRVDRERFVVNTAEMTGRQILELAGRCPPEQWILSQKLHGGDVVTIALDRVVDFRAPGVERFMTLPKDQTEG